MFIPFVWIRYFHGHLSLSLEPTTGPGNSYRLIHHPLANSQVFVYPDIDILVLGDRILLETGSKVPKMGLVSQTGLEGEQFEQARKGASAIKGAI